MSIPHILGVAFLVLSGSLGKQDAAKSVPTFASLPDGETLRVQYSSVSSGCVVDGSQLYEFQLTFHKKERLFVTISALVGAIGDKKGRFVEIGKLTLTREDAQKLDARIRYVRSLPQGNPGYMMVSDNFQFSHFRGAQKLAEDSFSKVYPVRASVKDDALTFSDLVVRVAKVSSFASLPAGEALRINAGVVAPGQFALEYFYTFSRKQKGLSVNVTKRYVANEQGERKLVDLGEIALTSAEVRKLDELLGYLRNEHKPVPFSPKFKDVTSTDIGISRLIESQTLPESSESFSNLEQIPREDLRTLLSDLVDRFRSPTRPKE